MEVVKAQEPITSLISPETNIQGGDAIYKMLALKYAAPCIQVLHPDEFIRLSKVLLLKIHVITGWVIPANELMLILVDQFQKKLQETYFNLNCDEIEYAFRQNGTVIEDWGKEMNLNLLDKVLIPYLNQRMMASADEEKSKTPSEQKIYSAEEILNEHRAITEACYQRFLTGDITYFPTRLMYDVLVSDGFISPNSSVKEFYTEALAAGRKNIYQKQDE